MRVGSLHYELFKIKHSFREYIWAQGLMCELKTASDDELAARQLAVLTWIWVAKNHIGFPIEIIEQIARLVCTNTRYLQWDAAFFRHQEQLKTLERRKRKPILLPYAKQGHVWQRKIK